MKAWEKLEEKLNLLLTSLSKILLMFVAKSTPTSIKASIEKRKGRPFIDLHTFQEKLFSIKKFFDGISGKISNFLAGIFLFFRNIDAKRFDWEKIFMAAFAIVSPFIGRIRDWYISLKPTTLLALVSITTMGGLSSIAIYKQVQKISDESRNPASEMVEEVEAGTVPSKRPSYYKQQERELRVRNVSFPVYVGARGPASTKKVVIDFTFVASNRYIKEYFYENVHLLKDKLNTSVEQILPEFPLEDDGKRVIKEKIKKEIQALLNDLKIEGSIENVYIHSIMAG